MEKEKLAEEIVEKMTEEELKQAAKTGIMITLELYSRAFRALAKELKNEKHPREEINNGTGSI